MSGDSAQVTAARIEAERARAQLMQSAHRLQERLSPRTLARDAWEGAKEKGAGLAENAVDALRSRPLTATGILAGIGMFLAREPLKDLVGKVAEGRSSKDRATPGKKKPPVKRRQSNDPKERQSTGRTQRARRTVGQDPEARDPSL
jgi:ElaB/YqjD/DUF883 family membrane-anchored ribosome-binding protein